MIAAKTREGLRLVRAFEAMEDPAARKALIAFAESYASLSNRPPKRKAVVARSKGKVKKAPRTTQR